MSTDNACPARAIVVAQSGADDHSDSSHEICRGGCSTSRRSEIVSVVRRHDQLQRRFDVANARLAFTERKLPCQMKGQTSWQIRHLALILRFQGMDWPFSLSRTLNRVNASPWRQMAISFGAVGAIASIAISPIWDQQGESPPAAIQPRQAHPTASHHPESADASMFKVFALNALLIPVLDDDVPSRWTEPFALMSCVGSTLTIDGKPVIPGSRVPSASFLMRWSMNQCTALGEAFVMSGTVDLLVFHDGDSYSAVVQPTNLRLDSSSGSAVLTEAFAAFTPLGTWSHAASYQQIARSEGQRASGPPRVPAPSSGRDSPQLTLPSMSPTGAWDVSSYKYPPSHDSK